METSKKEKPAVDQTNKSYILGYSTEGMAGAYRCCETAEVPDIRFSTFISS